MTGDQDARRNYAVLLGQGISFDAATDLTSVKLVLPFLYTTAGAPVLFAGMLVPVWTVAKRLVQVFVAPLVGAARSNKTLMALASLVSALAIVLISLTFNTAGVYWLVPIFLSVALIIGAANGVGSLGFQDLVGRVLSPERRRKLLFTQSSIAAMIVVIIAFGSQAILKPGTSLAAHQELIWLGIGLFLLSALTDHGDPGAGEAPTWRACVARQARRDRSPQGQLSDCFRPALVRQVLDRPDALSVDRARNPVLLDACRNIPR